MSSSGKFAVLNFVLALATVFAEYNCTSVDVAQAQERIFPNLGLGTCLGGWLVLEPW
jgi:hypothetical protein